MYILCIYKIYKDPLQLKTATTTTTSIESNFTYWPIDVNRHFSKEDI